MPKHLISTSQFNESKDLEPIFINADMMASPWKKTDPLYALRGRTVGLLFLENSTRTKASFQVAAQKLGCHTFNFDQTTSSLSKGESVEDTAKILSQYSDALVVRLRDHNLLEKICSSSSSPVINAGSNEHPTQAITDLYTIKKERGKIHGTNILIMGDLKYSRSVFSLINLLKLYKNIRIHLCAPVGFELPRQYLYDNIIYVENEPFNKVLPKVDVVYVTRPQNELHTEFDLMMTDFFFTEKDLALLRNDAIIMHPLPRNSEIAPAIDSDPRAAYFRQAKNGLYIRMAILQEIMKA
jgi:aspartate carbamoyltransferase